LSDRHTILQTVACLFFSLFFIFLVMAYLRRRRPVFRRRVTFRRPIFKRRYTRRRRRY